MVDAHPHSPPATPEAGLQASRDLRRRRDRLGNQPALDFRRPVAAGARPEARRPLGRAYVPASLRIMALLAALALLFSAAPLGAQQLALDLGDDGALGVRAIQLIVLITLLSLAPGLLIMLTCFPFIVTVLSILRQAIGLQQSPPNMLIVSLALFLTWFIMEPVFIAAWEAGVLPLNAGDLPLEEAVLRALEPFRLFMAARTDPGTFGALAALRPDAPEALSADAPLSVLIPGFMLSEVARAFQIGFLIFLPFLIIDLVVAAVLMSMGMMMVPPAVVSLPFKLSFFVIADGWALLAQALVRSYF